MKHSEEKAERRISGRKSMPRRNIFTLPINSMIEDLKRVGMLHHSEFLSIVESAISILSKNCTHSEF